MIFDWVVSDDLLKVYLYIFFNNNMIFFIQNPCYILTSKAQATYENKTK
jgi:hypothetical protein